ncbi:C39 family peptidase [Bacillus sp. BRMEA1]|uniref:C39 family peptidase n=1 Tax=Neobacillus endophyticus TaxID=2738405 RepID=UPI00156696E4|nr:C39 family peptidase [Neobacillus endophyticus]NRD79060.1 C39 family peptidase [Neobacillus endophyticus]
MAGKIKIMIKGMILIVILFAEYIGYKIEFFSIFRPSIVNAASIKQYTTDSLPVRIGSSAKFKTQRTITKGTNFTIAIRDSNDWVQTLINGKKRFSNRKNINTMNVPFTSYHLNVPIFLQKPELPGGCEVTCLAMALQYKGVNVDKLTLARRMPYTKTLDPNRGYVGSPYNDSGYTINPVKLQLLARVYRSQSSDMTGASIKTIENEVRRGNPVLAWYTIGYGDVRDMNHFKYRNGHQYWWPQPLHCIVVSGVSKYHFYINDPYNGNKNYPIEKTKFARVYTEMGRRALVIR